MDNTECRDILFNCLKNLDIQVKEIFALSKQNQECQIIGECQLAEITESMKFINEKFTKYEEERKEKEQEIKDLKDQISLMTNDMKDL